MDLWWCDDYDNIIIGTGKNIIMIMRGESLVKVASHQQRTFFSRLIYYMAVLVCGLDVGW